MKQGIFLRGVMADAKEVTVDIVGVIGWEVWFPAMRDLLATIPEAVERVVFDIYSPGGDVWEGNAIMQLIGGMQQHTVARVQVAASMATLIAVACKERHIASNGRFLVHNAWTITQGDADTHEKRAKELRDCEDEAVKFYASRTGKPEADIRALMADERWLTPEETKEWGFVEQIDNPFDAASFAAVRAELAAAGKWPVALADMPQEQDKGGKTDDADTTGAAGNAITPPVVAVDTALQSKPDADVEAARLAAFAAGQAAANEALLARARAGEERVLKLVGDLAALQTKHDAAVAEGRKLQGERDHSRASDEKHAAALAEATAKITRLLAGGMTFSPSVETWEQALTACGGDWSKARNQFPEVYRAQRENDKHNRK